jgi:hypothetical protein
MPKQASKKPQFSSEQAAHSAEPELGGKQGSRQSATAHVVIMP